MAVVSPFSANATSTRRCNLSPFSEALQPHSLADDMLHGAAEIAQFLFGDVRHRRKVYYLIEAGLLPVLRLGGICARKSTLLAWLKKQELAAITGYDLTQTREDVR